MATEEERDPQGGLVDVLRLIASRLREPLFLFGLGAAILLTLIALWGPEDGQVYAALLAGLIFLLAVVWALTSGRRPASRTGHRVRTGFGSRVGDVRQSGTGMHDVGGGGFGRIGDVDQSGDPQRPSEER